MRGFRSFPAFIVAVVCALSTFSDIARASGLITNEGHFAHTVATASQQYASEHGGRSPSSWSEFDGYIYGPLDVTFRYVVPTKRYAFLPTPLHLPPPHQGELLIVTRRPFREVNTSPRWFQLSRLEQPGRYIIYRLNAGDFRTAYVDEAYIQQAFRGSGHLLPVPDSEPDRPWEVKLRREAFGRLMIVCLVTALIFAGGLAFCWRAGGQR
jgi:hypothetical protein